MRIAARHKIGDLELRWVVRESVTAAPSYQLHHLVLKHALCPEMSRVEFMGHRQEVAAVRYQAVVDNANAAAHADAVI